MSRTLTPALFAAALLLLLSSCSTYEYMRIDSGGMARNDNKDLVWETDTIKLTYNFHGHDAPMKVTIYNKSERPLYIDWKRSALIRNQQSISLFDSHVDFTGSGSGFAYGGRRWAYTETSFSGTMNLPEGIEMIAPHAYINKDLLKAYDGRALLDSSSSSSLPVKTALADGYPNPQKYKAVTYSKESAPQLFTAYLTFVLGNEGKDQFSVTNPFYASGIMRSRLNPQDFVLYGNDGDLFYTKEKAN